MRGRKVKKKNKNMGIERKEKAKLKKIKHIVYMYIPF